MLQTSRDIGFSSKLPGEVLMAIDIVARKINRFKFWTSAFNFWKQGPLKVAYMWLLWQHTRAKNKPRKHFVSDLVALCANK